MSNHVLVIEDDEGLSNIIRIQLERAGYEVRTAHLGQKGLDIAREWDPDLILLDVLMPDMDGWTVFDALREFTTVPILFITALGTDGQIRHGLELGADDYIVKPFHGKELIARVHAALYRSQRVPAGERVIEAGPLRIDVSAHRVWQDGRPIPLTRLEFRLLTALARRAGQVVTHRELIRQVWGTDDEGKRTNLKLYILYLRRKLEKDPSAPTLIVSVRGRGYRLSTAEVEEPS